MEFKFGSFVFWGITSLVLVTQLVYEVAASRLVYFQSKKEIALALLAVDLYFSFSIVLLNHDAELEGQHVRDYLSGWKALRIFYRPLQAFWWLQFEVKLFLVFLILGEVFVIMIAILEASTALWVASNVVAYVSVICLGVMASMFIHYGSLQLTPHHGWHVENILAFVGKEPIAAGNSLRFWIHTLTLENYGVVERMK